VDARSAQVRSRTRGRAWREHPADREDGDDAHQTDLGVSTAPSGSRHWLREGLNPEL
jgi:hypothetical protein